MKEGTGDVEELPFKSNVFDNVISFGVLHHTPNTEKGIKEIYRVLKPGGKAFLSFYYKNFLLRQPMFWFMTIAMRILGIKPKGREKMPYVKNPDEFVRIYDGNENPLGKAYSKQ